MSILAIDFGGTRLRAGRFSPDLTLEVRQETPSLVDQTAEQVIQRMIELAKTVMEGATPAAIGMAAPGPLDAKAGVIYHAKTLPGWQNTPLAALVSQAFEGIPVHMHNDGNLAALAEYHLGAGRGANPTLYMTISTGIGGGAVINGELFTGWRGLAIEPGHIQINHPDGKVYRLEELASGTGLGRVAQERLAFSNQQSALRDKAVVTGQAVGEAALKGDAFALEIVREAGYWLGIGLVNLLHLFNPQAIVVGGSVSQLGELLFAPARQVITERILDPRFYEPEIIRRAQLGDDVCLYGAALYAHKART